MSDNIPDLQLPEDMQKWASEVGLGEVGVHASDIALSLSITLPEKCEPDKLDGFRAAIRHLAEMVREAGREAQTPWQLVIILDASACIPKSSWKAWHEATDTLANDQEWHGGELSLYLVPVVEPDTEWWGPKTAEELRLLLLDVGAQVKQLPEVKRVLLADLDLALEEHSGDLPVDLVSAISSGPEALSAWTRRRIQEVNNA